MEAAWFLLWVVGSGELLLSCEMFWCPLVLSSRLSSLGGLLVMYVLLSTVLAS
jgi:hypothetical protein